MFSRAFKILTISILLAASSGAAGRAQGVPGAAPKSPVAVITSEATKSAIAPAVAPAVATAPAPAFRLGDAATPLHYALRLVIDPARDEFEGEVSIAINVNRPESVLWLNAHKLSVQSATIEVGAAKGASNTNDNAQALAIIAGNENFVGFAAATPIPTGPARLNLRYRGKIDALLTEGLFRQREGNDWYVISQFESHYARRAVPCFDEPGWKTPWQLTLEVPQGNIAVSNTPQVSETSLANGMKRVTFAVTKPLPAYLVALAIGPFEVVDGGTAGKEKFAVRYLAPRGRGGDTRYAREITPKLIEILEDYFGTPYPFEKLDSVSIPQTIWFGAMENPGLITYASRLLIARPNEESIAFKRRYASIAAHEIAHQWFGNLVTMQWWDDTWLNEAFATWMASKTTARFNVEWNDGYWRAVSRRMAVGQDQLSSARRVINPVTSEGDIRAAFDSITYQKGGKVLEMFEQVLGEEKFRDGVRRYLARHARGNATSDDFMTALAEAAGPGSNLAADFKGFVTQPGVPLIDIALDCKARPTLKLVQERLRGAGSKLDGTERWNTPACFRYSVKGKTYQACSTVSNGASAFALPDLKTCPDWVMANANGMGYYVARYDKGMLARLSRNTARLPVAESVTLVGDISILADSGLVPMASALTLADRLATHSSPVVNQAVADLLRGLRPGWTTGNDQQQFQQILAGKIVPQARKVGWLEKSGEHDRVRSLRTVLLPLAADQGGDVALRKQAAVLSLRWIKGREGIPGGIADAALNVAGAFADAGLFDAMEKEAFAASDRNDRSRLLKALSGVREPALRERAYALALDPRVNGRDALALLVSAMENDHNRDAAFAYVRKNFDSLSARLPKDSPTSIMRVLARACTTGERDAFAGFFRDRNTNYLGGPRAYAQAIERMDLCIAARGVPKIVATR